MKMIIAGGCGYVGLKIKELFPEAYIYDPPAGIVDQPEYNYDFCHIAVPTPMSPDGSADTSAVEDVLQKIKADLYLIHSTIPPGTVDKLEGIDYEYNIVFQPEYVASDSIYPAPLGDMKKMPFIILGGRSENTERARRLYERVYPPTVEIFETDAKTAETIKYLENAFIATKVVFCSEAARMCEKFGVRYSDARKGVFRLDPRMTEWWTLSEGKGYKSKCLDKDIPAIIHASEKAGYNPEFLKTVVKSNERFKNG